jgi:hypothetical protein
MKGAKSFKIFAGFFQDDMFRNHRNDIGAVANLINDIIGY